MQMLGPAGISSRQVACVALGMALAGLTWAYCSRLNDFTQERLNSLGFGARNFSDLYPRWLGARELLLHHQNPYSQSVTTEIQRGYYGRPIDPRRPGDPVDEQRFAYPVFVVLLFAPTIRLPFATARIVFECLFLAMAVATVWLWAASLRVFSAWQWELVSVLFALASIPYMQAFLVQQITIVVVLCLAGAFAALRRENGIIAGALLALATIKPQLSLPFILWVLFWSLASGRQRSVVVSFGAAMAGLLIYSHILLPSWISDFIGSLHPYLRYTNATSGLKALLGKQAGSVVTWLLACGVGLFCCWKRKAAPDSFEFVICSMLVLAWTAIAVPTLAPHVEVLLVPACLLLWHQRGKMFGGRISRPLWYGGFLVVVWPWVSVAALLIGARVFPIHGNEWDLPLATNPINAVILFTALLPMALSSTKHAGGNIQSAYDGQLNYTAARKDGG